MPAMRHASPLTRSAWGALLALLLAVRLLSPAGFMPAFEHGRVTIVACPDADGIAQSMAAHHHPGDHRGTHQPCPYASASSLGALGADFGPLLSVQLPAGAAPIGITAPQLSLGNERVRPPTRAPPIPS
jgi:hypothetical protein